MTYRYKVTLSGIKGFFRIYQVNANNSLYSFHKQMRADMGFPADQLILFKALDADGAVVARYGLFDLGYGIVDDITISKTIQLGITSFVYFYDVENKKSVNITLEGEDTVCVLHPTLTETKGPDPIEFENGYVAFEDLPDEQRHLPGENPERKKHSLADLLGIDLDKDLDDEDEDDEDDDEEEEDEEEDVIYDADECI